MPVLPRQLAAQIRMVDWRPPAQLPSRNSWSTWVQDQVAPVLDELGGVNATPVVIGKSLGSYAAPLIAKRGLPAVWLTPLLADEMVVAALRETVARMLLIGGTADTAWDGALARKLSPHVLEVDGADHVMYVPGPFAASAAVLALVVTAVERFLDDVVWRPG
jgi:hypothetical protein